MNKKDGIYFFTGEDEFKKSLSVNKLKSKLSLPPDSLDINIYYGKDINMTDVISSLDTPPFLSRKRLVIIKEAEKLSEADKNKLIPYFKKGARTSICIIETKKNLNVNDRFNAAAKKYASIIDFPMLEAEKIPAWIRKEFQLRGKIVEPAAIEFLAENSNNQLAVIRQHIDMLTAYAGKRKNITQADVKNLIGESAQLSVFKLVDEISQKRQRLAFETLLLLLQAGKDAHEILGLVAWHMRRLGKAKTLLAKEGLRKEQLSQRLKISYYSAQKLIHQAQQFTLDEIKKAQELLLDMDMRLKKSVTAPEALLELLVMRLSSNL